MKYSGKVLWYVCVCVCVCVCAGVQVNNNYMVVTAFHAWSQGCMHYHAFFTINAMMCIV